MIDFSPMDNSVANRVVARESRSCRYSVWCSFSCSDKWKLLLLNLFQSLSGWSFWWSKSSWSLQRFLPFSWWTEEKLVVVAGRQMAGVACFWDLYSEVELCKRLVTFSAAYGPWHKGSAVEFCTSAASVFSIFLAVLVWNCKVPQPVFFSGRRWIFTGTRGLHAEGAEFCCEALNIVPGASLMQLTAGLCRWAGRIQNGVSPAQVYIQTGLASLVVNTCSKKLSMSGTCKIIVSFHFNSI